MRKQACELRIYVRDSLKRTWSRDTRLEGRQKLAATGVLASQLTGKIRADVTNDAIEPTA